MRVRERLSAAPGQVIGQGLLPREALFPAAAAVAVAVAENALSFPSSLLNRAESPSN